MFLFLITFKEVCFHLRSFAFQAAVVMRFQNYKSLSAYLLTVYIIRTSFENHLARTVCEHFADFIVIQILFAFARLYQ